MGYTPPQLEVRKIAGGWSLYPPSSTTGDDLTIYPNGADTTGFIKLQGGSDTHIGAGTAKTIQFFVGAAQIGYISFTTPNLVITAGQTNGNVSLVPNGTGVVQFGTHTGSGDVACNGSIAIKDAAGNARKLMTTA